MRSALDGFCKAPVQPDSGVGNKNPTETLQAEDSAFGRPCVGAETKPTSFQKTCSMIALPDALMNSAPQLLLSGKDHDKSLNLALKIKLSLDPCLDEFSLAIS